MLKGGSKEPNLGEYKHQNEREIWVIIDNKITLEAMADINERINGRKGSSI